MSEDLPAIVARACRILHQDGHEHLVFGHVSARDASGALWVKSSGLGLEEVDREAVSRMDADGQLLAGGRLHDEMALHTEIYKARPDVGSVVHTHAPGAIALSLARHRLPVRSQDAVQLAGHTAFYDSAALVTTRVQGRDLAACLGDGRAVLLRGHGLVTVGADVAEATVLAVLLERVARLELATAALGEVGEISDDDVRRLAARYEGGRRVETIWRYLCRRDAAAATGQSR